MKLMACVAAIVLTIFFWPKKPTVPAPATPHVLSGVVRNADHPKERTTIRVGVVQFGSAADRLHINLWSRCEVSSDPDCFSKAVSQTLASGLQGLRLAKVDATGHFTLPLGGAESYLVVSAKDTKGWLWCPADAIWATFLPTEQKGLSFNCWADEVFTGKQLPADRRGAQGLGGGEASKQNL